MKRKIKLSNEQQMQLDVVRRCERRKPIPRPVVFKTKKDYNRQANKQETMKQCKDMY